MIAARWSVVFLSIFVLLPATAASFRGAVPVKGSAPAPKGGAATDNFEHELWGQTSYGSGYVYGPVNRASGVTLTDLDLDGDEDVIVPNPLGNPQLVRNLGSSSAYYPGGISELDLRSKPATMIFDLGLEFGDLNGDRLPDLLAVVRTESPFRKRIIYFKNDGPREDPKFTYQGIVYESQRDNVWRGMWLTLGDIDGDGDRDLYVAEDFADQSAPYHRLFICENTGSANNPQFAPAVLNAPMSNLLPTHIVLKEVAEAAKGTPASAETIGQTLSDDAKQAAFGYNLGDIALADWNDDGILDFMFYSKTEGLLWIPNLGSNTAPSFANFLGDGGDPSYSHQFTDGVTFAEATFAIRENPEAAKPGSEWLTDVYLSVNDRLKTYRYFTEDAQFRIVSESAVAFQFGQGPPVFFDHDGDGDLDLFRTRIGANAADTNLALVPNVGTAYNPAWGPALGIPQVHIEPGNAANFYRQDAFTITQYDPQGSNALFIQRQDGRIALYFIAPPLFPGGPPIFTPSDENFGNVVAPGDTGIWPQGIAAADFDNDGFVELVTCYSHANGAEIVVVDLYEEGGDLFYTTYRVNELFPDPDGTGNLNPIAIESLTAADINQDGQRDLLLSTSTNTGYASCEIHAFETSIFSFDLSSLSFSYDFLHRGRVDTAFETDAAYARMPGAADIDGDGDDDLFVGHRYPEGHGSGLRQYLRFYRNSNETGLQYVRFRVVSGREWPLWLELTTGGGSNVETVKPDYYFVRNASGGTLLNDAIYETGDNSPAVDILQTTNLRADYGFPDEVRVFVDVLPPVGANESKAIIVVGDVATGTLYPAFGELAAFAYRVLLSEGLSKDSIRFYAAGAIEADSQEGNDVTGAPSIASLQQSVTQWAQNTDRLLIYLIDHGQRDRFRMNATEYLNASQLDGWLDQVQAGGQGPQITTLIDTCEAGTFLDNIKGARRVNITGANAGPIEGVALFDKDEYISFSLHFWTRLYNGDSYGKAFDEAKTAIEAINPLQRPQIDDDGDGVGNEGNDGLTADGLRPGADFDVQGPNVFIGSIAPPQKITSNSATLWLSGVLSAFPVEGAKAIIVPPNFERPELGNDDEQPLSNLPSVLFTYNAALNRWQGTYNGFSQGGLFQVQYFVKVGGQYYASPRIGFVDRLGIPDAWEVDNTSAQASWLSINTVQGHNFHQANDADWLRFTAPAGETATIAVLAPAPNCRPVVALYREADLASGTPFRTVESPENGSELVFTQDFAAAQTVFARISNFDPAIAGEGTSYLALVAVGTGGGGLIATTLICKALDAETLAPISGARVSFAGAELASTDADGSAYLTVTDYGNFNVTVAQSAYQSATQTVNINNMIENVSFVMVKATEPPPPTGGCGGGKQGGSGNAVLTAALPLLLLWRARRGNFKVRP